MNAYLTIAQTRSGYFESNGSNPPQIFYGPYGIDVPGDGSSDVLLVSSDISR